MAHARVNSFVSKEEKKEDLTGLFFSSVVTSFSKEEKKEDLTGLDRGSFFLFSSIDSSKEEKKDNPNDDVSFHPYWKG